MIASSFDTTCPKNKSSSSIVGGYGDAFTRFK
jgi:hypothetical protein